MPTNCTRALIAALATVVATTAIVSAHMAYSRSLPEKDATISESPSEVQIWFTQNPEPAISQLSLEGSSGEIALGDTAVGAEKSIVAAVPTTLGPGSYTVKWRSAGDDGHVQRGEFGFTIRTTD